MVPCAGMALVWTGLLKGDVPLATVVNAATMIAAPFLIPWLMQLLAGAFIAVDAAAMFQSVMLTVLAPIIGGILTPRGAGTPEGHDALRSFHAAIFGQRGCFSHVHGRQHLRTAGARATWHGSVRWRQPWYWSFRFFSSGPMRSAAPFLPTGKNIAITFSSGMKNLPIAVAIAAVSLQRTGDVPGGVGLCLPNDNGGLLLPDVHEDACSESISTRAGSSVQR
ncbi:MAG: bile acid:sodium symporter [Desulfobacterales bacterium]|nr:bile acid:sodium symporter [Desulfobacterales bacterium]